jgi:hypothetical protein
MTQSLPLLNATSITPGQRSHRSNRWKGPRIRSPYAFDIPYYIAIGRLKDS